MTINSSNNNKIPGVVIHKNELEQTIISILESTNTFENDFYSAFDALPKDKRYEFVSEMYDWISTARASRYYMKTYERFEKDEQPIFKYGEQDIELAKLTDTLYKSGTRKENQLDYPATNCWLDRKRKEIITFFNTLELLYHSLLDKQQLHQIKAPENDLKQDDEYYFPAQLIDKTFDKISFDNSFRIAINLPKQTLLKHFKKQFKPLSQCFDSQNYEAFLYNTFQFENNTTTPTSLNLKCIVQRGIFKHHLSNLYEKFKLFYGIEKKPFANTLIMNFVKDRNKFDFSDKVSFNKRFISLEKSIRLKKHYVYKEEN